MLVKVVFLFLFTSRNNAHERGRSTPRPALTPTPTPTPRQPRTSCVGRAGRRSLASFSLVDPAPSEACLALLDGRHHDRELLKVDAVTPVVVHLSRSENAIPKVERSSLENILFFPTTHLILWRSYDSDPTSRMRAFRRPAGTASPNDLRTRPSSTASMEPLPSRSILPNAFLQLEAPRPNGQQRTETQTTSQRNRTMMSGSSLADQTIGSASSRPTKPASNQELVSGRVVEKCCGGSDETGPSDTNARCLPGTTRHAPP